MGFALMGFETRVSEKVPTSIVTPLRGFQTHVGERSGNRGTLLETATSSLVVVRFETVGIHTTAA